MGLSVDSDGQRLFAPRLLGTFVRPDEFDHLAASAFDQHGAVAVWTTGSGAHRFAGNPALLAAYETSLSAASRTLVVPQVPVSLARAAWMPGGDWLLAGPTGSEGSLLRVLTATGALRAEGRIADSIGQIATDSDGFVWVAGGALTKLTRGLEQIWQSPGGVRDDASVEAVNVAPGVVVAGQTFDERPATLLRVREGQDTVTIPVPDVEGFDAILIDGDWVGILPAVECELVVGTLTGDEFAERFRVALRDKAGHSLYADEVTSRGDTAYLSNGYDWYTLTLAEVVADRPQEAPRDAAPPARHGWFGWGRG